MANIGIYQNLLRPPKSVAEYDQEAQASQLNALNINAGRMKQDEYTRGVADQNALRDVYRQFGNDTDANANKLFNAGLGAEALKYKKSALDLGKTGAEIGKDTAQTAGYKLDQSIKAHEFQVQKLGSVGTPQDAMAWAQDALQSGVFTPEQYQRGVMALQQASQSPQAFAQWKQQALQGGASATEQLKMQAKAEADAKDFGLKAANEIMTPDGKGGFIPNAKLIGAKAGIAKAGASSVSVNTGQKGYENESKLRNDFKSEPIYKDFADMKTAHAQIKGSIAQGTPIADTATATKIMKLLDPGSVVRESELAIAMAAAGKLDRMQNYVQMQISGHKLTPQQRKDFGALADELMTAATQQYNAKRSEYEGFGKSYGLNPEVLGPSATPIKPAGKPAAGGLTQAEKAELEQLRKQLGR